MSERTKQGLINLLLVLLVLTIAFIWGNSLMDREQSSGFSNKLLDFIAPLLEAFGMETESDHWLRKFAHFAEFGLLGMELSLLLWLKKCFHFKMTALAALFCLLVAAVDETLQLFTGRACQVSDVLLDFSGSLCAIFITCLIALFFRVRFNHD